MIVCYRANGEIFQIVRGVTLESYSTAHLDADIEVLELPDNGEDTADFYVLGSALRPRPNMAIEWYYEAGEVVMDGVPLGALIRTPNWEGVVESETVVWPVTEPGIYHIYLELFPYRDEEIRAEIT